MSFNPSILPWSPFGTLYPAGGDAWSGQPVALTPIGAFFTPKVPINAEEMNWVLTTLSVSTAALRDTEVLNALSSYVPIVQSTAVASGTTFPPNGILPSTAHASWFALPWVNTTTDSDVYFSGDGQVWINLFDSGTHAIHGQVIAGKFANDPTDPHYADLVTVQIETATVFTSVIHVTTNGATRFNHTSQAFMAGITQGILARFANPDWSFLGFAQTGGTFTGIYGTSADGVGAWTDAHGILPACWSAGTNHIGRVFNAQPTIAFGVTAYTVFATGGVTPGVDTSHVCLHDPAGSFTDITPGICTGNIITGFAYDPIAALWGMVLFDGTASRLYTSTDHTVWHLNKTFALIRLDSLAVVSNVWASVYAVAGLNNTRVTLSSNVPAAHAAAGTSIWGRASGGSLIADGVVGIAPTLSSSGNQLALFTGVQVQISAQCGQVEQF